MGISDDARTGDVMEDLQTNVVIFQEADQPVEVRLDVRGDTVWLTQRQMGVLFDTTPENVVMHLKKTLRIRSYERRQLLRIS